MSDSDNDLLPANVFSFRNENMTINARGPNINTTSLSSVSFRNRMPSSTMHIQRNYEKERYMTPSFDQRSFYCRRDSSPPMSLHSASDFRPRHYQNYNNGYYPSGMSSHRSMINGRGDSPISVRTIDSNTTVRAADIAMALKTTNFNKYDLRVIKDAFNKLMKKRTRKRIEKRQNRRIFMKGHRRKSGYDSGELGSDSSISSDDGRSTSSAFYKNNVSSCRSTVTDLTDFRRTIRESNMYRDCTDNFRQNTLRNIFNYDNNRDNRVENMSQTRTKNVPPVLQNDRFKMGYLLPSQRFNKSVASLPIPEKQKNYVHNSQTSNLNGNNPVRDGMQEIESEQEEIFSERSIRENSVYSKQSQHNKNTEQRKRKDSLNDSDELSVTNKRSKLSSPPSKRDNTIQMQKDLSKQGVSTKDKKNDKEFEFVKPQFPVKKPGNVKVKEKLLAKSAQPLVDNLIPEPNTIHQNQTSKNNKEDICSKESLDETQNSIHTTNDVSMRPSFIKRKLYTQKLDVIESKNTNTDNLLENSPQTNIYSAIHKEKNKARKLVTNQSCLSRDVVQEGNNLLDLIHKIVPPDRMNVTNMTNKNETVSKDKTKQNNNDKWDVTSIISTCNKDDGSDTYTDEEIFKMDENRKSNNKVNKTVDKNKTANKEHDKNKTDKINKTQDKNISNCKILVEKLPITKVTTEQKKLNVSGVKTDVKKRNVYSCVKSFWDTDIDSDIENFDSIHKSDSKTRTPYKNVKSTCFGATKNTDLQKSTIESKTIGEKQINANTNFQSRRLPHTPIAATKTTNASENISKRTPQPRKEYTCCKENPPPKEIKATKTLIKDTSNAKRNMNKKTVLELNNSTLSDTTIYNTTREMRSTRIAKRTLGIKTDDSISDCNDSLNRTLRSRQINISLNEGTTTSSNLRKSRKKPDTSKTKTPTKASKGKKANTPKKLETSRAKNLAAKNKNDETLSRVQDAASKKNSSKKISPKTKNAKTDEVVTPRTRSRAGYRS